MSLRVQVRSKGHKTEIRSFPRLADTPYERQRDETEAWATDVRRRMHGGVFISLRGAEAITLGDALRLDEKNTLDAGDLDVAAWL